MSTLTEKTDKLCEFAKIMVISCVPFEFLFNGEPYIVMDILPTLKLIQFVEENGLDFSYDFLFGEFIVVAK